MAIKLVNALRNLHIEENEIEIQKTISFLINNRGYKESQIDATLVIRDYDYRGVLLIHKFECKPFRKSRSFGISRPS